MIKQVDEMDCKEKEQLLEQIMTDIKEILSEKRFMHSVSTMEKSKQLAKQHNQDELTVMLTALAHDIAKEMTKEEYFKYAKENNIELDEIDNIEIIALHGKIGANIVKNKYGFTKEMQDAIHYHTTGRLGMNLFEKIIFLADKVEEKTRTQERTYKKRDIMENKGLDEAILFICEDYIIPKAIKNRTTIHPNTIFIRNDIIRKKVIL